MSGPTQTERDAARWNALNLSRSFVPCVSCVSVGQPEQWIDQRTAAVVPWHVMGDPRSFAFVCNECASGSEVVL